MHQRNFVLHTGDLATSVITKVSMCRFYDGQMGTETDHSSSNCVFFLLVSFLEFSVFISIFQLFPSARQTREV